LSAQGSATVRGLIGVAAAFGVTSNTTDPSGAQLLIGSRGGSEPFIAASLVNGAATPLKFFTNNTLAVTIGTAGEFQIGGTPQTVFDSARHFRPRQYSRATLPAASGLSGYYAEVSNPEAGKSWLVRSNGTIWQYVADQATVALS